MREYRLYFLDGGGHIQRVEIASADDDGGVMRTAREHPDGAGIEVWDEGRFVGEVRRLPRPPLN